MKSNQTYVADSPIKLYIKGQLYNGENEIRYGAAEAT